MEMGINAVTSSTILKRVLEQFSEKYVPKYKPEYVEFFRIHIQRFLCFLMFDFIGDKEKC